MGLGVSLYCLVTQSGETCGHIVAYELFSSAIHLLRQHGLLGNMQNDLVSWICDQVLLDVSWFSQDIGRDLPAEVVQIRDSLWNRSNSFLQRCFFRFQEFLRLFSAHISKHGTQLHVITPRNHPFMSFLLLYSQRRKKTFSPCTIVSLIGSMTSMFRIFLTNVHAHHLVLNAIVSTGSHTSPSSCSRRCVCFSRHPRC